MARAEIKMPEEFLLQLSRLGDQTDVVIPKVLEAGGEIVLAKVKGNLSAVIGHGTKSKSRSTGELLNSLGLSPAKQKRDGSGWDVKVGFNEPRRHQNTAKGKRSYHARTNAMVANVIEHGKHGQPAKPFMKPAKSQAKKAAIDAMNAMFKQEVGID